MALLTAQGLSLAYGIKPLLAEVSFQIERGERVCLIGRNGEGKSSLLRIISQEIHPDAGLIQMDTGIKLATLTQEVPRDLNRSVYEVVASGLEGIGEALSEYHALSAIAQTQADLERLGALQQLLDVRDGWNLDQKVMTIITRLDLPKDKLVAELSGGWMRRVLLGKALVAEPDILLLDEPTNHLDIEAILWLEEVLLKNFSGAVLFITHDRAFLQKIATKIMELDRGTLTEFPGDFNNYQRRKAEMLHAETLERALFDKRLAEEEVWIRKGIEARRTRNEGRVRALFELRKQYGERINRQGTVRLNFEEGNQSGRKVISATNISYAIDDKVIIKDFSLTLMRGDRIGLIGPNGVGKSTLLKLLFQKIQPQEGGVETGTKLEVAYFDQMRALLDPEKSVIDNVIEGSEFIEINGKRHHIIGWLQDFMFTPEKARSPVKSLSGGERNRLLLAKLFTRPANVLVLDEPTNDLDIETLEVLEELLMAFQGTLLIVSHDRAFLDQTVTSTLVFEGAGVIKHYVGGYSDWLHTVGADYFANKDQDQKNIGSKSVALKTTPAARPKVKPVKLNFNEARELKELPQRMAQIEQEIEALSLATQNPEFYKGDPLGQKQTLESLAELNLALELAFERWEYLETKSAALENS